MSGRVRLGSKDELKESLLGAAEPPSAQYGAAEPDEDASGATLRQRAQPRTTTRGLALGWAKGGKVAKARRGIESLDFDAHESLVNEKYHHSKTQWSYTRLAFQRWIINFFIALFTGLVAASITFVTQTVARLKFSTMGMVIAGFFTLLGIVMLLASIAGALVAFVEPVAAGSGISEVKCVLNGINIPRVVRLKTLAVKALGVVMSVASGLPVGKEGPMIHSGAVLAAGLSQGKTMTCGVDTSCTRVAGLRNDKEKRDMISCGAAAGVAAAFNAPVGGVLFSLEEGSSFWSQSLTWRSFFCAMIAAYTINFFLSGFVKGGHFGVLSSPGMFSFGSFEGKDNNSGSYMFYEIPIFLFIGALGGLLGALFNHANTELTRWRMKRVSHPLQRFAEAVGVAAAMAVVCFWLSWGLGRCRLKPAANQYTYEDELVQFYCAEGEFNDVASLLVNSYDASVKHLFHFPGLNATIPAPANATEAFAADGLPAAATVTNHEPLMTVPTTLVVYAVYMVMACITYGIAVPSGLFVPSLLSGAFLGRAIGVTLNSIGHKSVFTDPGTYALIGAAAQLGGMARMTVSLATILLESTGDYQFGLPLMVTLLAARWVGNAFNEGLYDVHIHLRHWPLLEEKPKKTLAHHLRVSDVMVLPPITLHEVCKVGEVVRLLKNTPHHGFPVVFLSSTLERNQYAGNFAGLIQRKHLSVLLARKEFYRNAQDVEAQRELDRRSQVWQGVEGNRSLERSASDTQLAGREGVGPEGLLYRGSAPGMPLSSGLLASLQAAVDSGGASPGAVSSGSSTPSGVPLVTSASLTLPALSSAGAQAAPQAAAVAGAASTAAAAAPASPGSAASAASPRTAASDSSQVRPPGGAVPAVAAAQQRGGRQATRHAVRSAKLDLGTAAARGNLDLVALQPLAGDEDHLASRLNLRPQLDEFGVEMIRGTDFKGSHRLTWADMEAGYPRYPHIEAIEWLLSQEDLHSCMDLRPYLNATPYTVHMRAPLTRAYRLFRTMGLRFLVVVNDAHDVVGIITRKELTEVWLEECLERKRKRKLLEARRNIFADQQPAVQ